MRIDWGNRFFDRWQRLMDGSLFLSVYEYSMVCHEDGVGMNLLAQNGPTWNDNVVTNASQCFDGFLR
jgi:hypothetical protein